MSLTLNSFEAWAGQPLSIADSTAPRVSGRGALLTTRSPSVTLTLQERGLVFEMWAPWWQNPAPSSAPSSLWGLWEHEVLEVFIVGDSGYLELEVGPHGHHLLLSLSAPREVSQVHETLDVHCERQDDSDLEDSGLEYHDDTHRAEQHKHLTPASLSPSKSWSSRGLLRHDILPQPFYDDDRRAYWRVNSFWCFQAQGTRFHCCAAPLPGDQPDFHQPTAFPVWPLDETLNRLSSAY